jgi:NADP-dependent 3-hydroxy acid dehydrogenase YdfG
MELKATAQILAKITIKLFLCGRREDRLLKRNFEF